MLLDRSAVGRHPVDRPPLLPCPYCHQSLLFDEEKLRIITTREFINAWEVGAVDPGTGDGHYHGELICSNASCKESVVSIGEFHDRLEKDYVREGPPAYDGYNPVRDLVYSHFLPPLPVFALPQGTPQGVTDAMVQAFAHTFADPAAAGNAVRRAIERLLDHFRVRKRVTTKKKKYRYLTLHERLEDYLPTKLSHLGEELLAVKWIGNDASHADLTWDSLLDAFEIVEVSLLSLFDDTAKRVRKRAKTINRRKKRKKK